MSNIQLIKSRGTQTRVVKVNGKRVREELKAGYCLALIDGNLQVVREVKRETVS